MCECVCPYTSHVVAVAVVFGEEMCVFGGGKTEEVKRKEDERCATNKASLRIHTSSLMCVA